MKKFLLMLITAGASLSFVAFLLIGVRGFSTAAASPIGQNEVRVEEIIDGDTFYIESRSWSPFPDLRWKIRLTGIDTPERKGKCAAERQAAKRATQLLTVIMRESDNVVTVENVRHDKYGGRFLADVYLKSGRQASDELLKSGLARPYHGVGAKPNWCEILQ